MAWQHQEVCVSVMMSGESYTSEGGGGGGGGGGAGYPLPGKC